MSLLFTVLKNNKPLLKFVRNSNPEPVVVAVVASNVNQEVAINMKYNMLGRIQFRTQCGSCDKS